MANEVDQLMFMLTARTKEFEKGMAAAERRVQRAEAKIAASSTAIEARTARMAVKLRGSLDAVASRWTALSRLPAIGLGFGAVGAATSVAAIAKYASEYRELRNQLATTGLQGEALEGVFTQLAQSALRNYAPLDSLVALYSKLALVSGDLGKSQQDILQFTGAVAKALRVGGVSAGQASGALLQLSQALGGGVVRAEEFNSILEGAPTIAQAMARGITEAGGSVSKLRQLMIDGRLSSKAAFDGMIAGSKGFDDQLKNTDQTVGQAFQNFRTQLILAAGQLDKSTGATDEAVSAVNSLASGIQNVTGVITALVSAGTPLVRWLRDVRDGINEAAEGFGKFTGLSRIGEAVNPILGQIDRSARNTFGNVSRDDLTAQRAEAQSAIDGFATRRRARGQSGSDAQQLQTLKDKLAAIDATIAAFDKAAATAAKAPAITAPISIDDPAYAVTNPKASKGRGGGGVYDGAKAYSGLREGRDDAKIRDLLRKGGGDFSGELRVWCADFVNAVLAEKGIKGTSSRSARSFLKFGEETTKPSEGDIVVLKRGKEGSGSGHVGFFQGYDDQGRVKVLGGNQSEGVNTQAYDPSRILGFRKQPEAGDDVSARLTAEATARKDATTTADRQAESIKRVMESLGLESSQIGKTAEQQKVLQELQAAGVDLNSREGQAIKAKVADLFALQAAQDATAKSAEDLKAAREEMASTGADATKGFVADLKAGKSAADALKGALDSILTKLTDSLIDGLFASIFQTGAKGGPGGGIIGKLFGFDEGGYTGNGGKNEVAGVVHGGEYVFSKDATKKLGRGNLEAMHRKAKGYASGGYVGAAMPVAIPRAAVPVARASSRGGGVMSVKTSIDLTGANGDETIRQIAEDASRRGVEDGLKKYDRNFGNRIQYEQTMNR